MAGGLAKVPNAACSLRGPVAKTLSQRVLR